MKKNLSGFAGILLASTFFSCALSTFVKTSDGVSIAYEHDKLPGAKGTAVLVHGLGSSLDEWYNFRKMLKADGWSVLALDLRGHGMSTQWKEGEINWSELTTEASQSVVQDLRAAAEYLKDEKNIWFIGSSFGANLSLAYAALDPEIAGVVLLTPGTNYFGIEAAPAMEKYRARPLMIVAGRDEAGAVQVAEWLFGQAEEPRKMLVSEEGGHGSVIIEQNQDIGKEVIVWMNQNTTTDGQKNISA